MTNKTLAALVAGLAGASAAFGAINVVQTAAPAPTYGTVLDFDAPGSPTGQNVPANSWAGLGLSSIVSGEGSNFVGNLSGTPGFDWLPNNNVFYGPFGVFMQFDSALSELSLQFWDSSGPSAGFGGGAAVAVGLGGQELEFYFVQNPAYAGLGDSWFNITATEGMSFDSVTVLGFGFFPESYVDNISWNKVPAPGTASLALLGLMVGGRRRR